jgi:hypothetical protein
MPKPSITRTPFVPVEPPAERTFYFCPACGAQVIGSYNMDPAKKRCTKTWHLMAPVPAKYVRAVASEGTERRDG